MKSLIACAALAWVLVALFACRSLFPNLAMHTRLSPLIGAGILFVPLVLVGLVYLSAKGAARLVYRFRHDQRPVPQADRRRRFTMAQTLAGRLNELVRVGH